VPNRRSKAVNSAGGPGKPNPLIVPSPEVAQALRQGRPVVALESTIISHGLPRPRNLEVARRLEAIVREEGATPATIAVLDGRLRVGLGDGDLIHLAATEGIAKISRRDLAAALASGGDGATTVSATMIAAHLAGIRVFATGGIGGVHRGAADSFDISADLQELGRTPVAVVCAGAKAILDLPKTLEVLETLGVPVIGHGTDTLPAFWCRSSGLKLPHRLDSAAEIASLLEVQSRLGEHTGTLVANPIPEQAALPNDVVEKAIGEAIKTAEEAGVTGAAVTPYLLSRLNELTGGASLEANIALVENNARLAAEIAVRLADEKL
jgi:pseudouridine-5'-phosphate glycosidase